MSRKTILDSENIASHTREVLRLKDELAANRSAGILIEVEIGQHLNEVRGQLTKGPWGVWLSKHIEVSPEWARDLMNLALVHTQNPEWVKEIGRLGETKALRAARASAPFRWELSPSWKWNGVTAKKMTTKQFDNALDAADPGAERRPGRPQVAKFAAPKSIDDVIAYAAAFRQQVSDPVEWRRLADWLAPQLTPAAPIGPAVTVAEATAAPQRAVAPVVSGRRTHSFPQP